MITASVLLAGGVPASAVTATDAQTLQWECQYGYFCIYSQFSGHGRVAKYQIDRGGNMPVPSDFGTVVQSYYFDGNAKYDACMWEHGIVVAKISPNTKKESVRAWPNEFGSCPR